MYDNTDSTKIDTLKDNPEYWARQKRQCCVTAIWIMVLWMLNM